MINSGYTYTDRISRDHAGWTVLDYYTKRHPHFTRAQWLERIEAGRITCAGRVLTPDDILAAGDLLAYFRPPWTEPPVTADIPILHQDEHVLVFDKPDRMPVLPGGEYLEHSMVMIVRRHIDPALSPLHRLGRGTTGAILFTRNQDAAVAFSRMMRRREITKTYLALVHNAGMPDDFTIETPIGRVPHQHLGEIHDVTPSGKPSVSICTVLARNPETDTALLQVVIPTGRTHQIRIHLASAGHPLVGDMFYTRADDEMNETSGTQHPVLPGDPGYILHSWRLQYSDPVNGHALEVTAPVRQEILAWCRRSGNTIP